MYRVVIQASADDEALALGERRVELFSDPRPALERLDRLTAMRLDAMAERREADGWTLLPDDELAALADTDDGMCGGARLAAADAQPRPRAAGPRPCAPPTGVGCTVRPLRKERVMVGRFDSPPPSSFPRRRTLLGGFLASLLAVGGQPVATGTGSAAAPASRLAPLSEQTQRCPVPMGGSSVDCSVRCPPGQVALSGGFSAASGVALSQFARLGPDGWLVTASATSDQPQPVVLVKVYCTA